MTKESIQQRSIYDWLKDEDAVRARALQLGLEEIEKSHPGILISSAATTWRYLSILNIPSADLPAPYWVPTMKEDGR